MSNQACTKKSADIPPSSQSESTDEDSEPQARREHEQPASLAVWQTLRQMGPGTKTPPESVSKLIGKEIRVAGFAIVNDAGSADNVKEFLLTPVAGGCVHVPPPPPNYIVHVSMADGKKTSIPFGPVEVSGKLRFPKNPKDREYYSFELVGNSVEDYRTARAREERSQAR